MKIKIGKIKIGKTKIGIITLLIAGLMILTAGLVSAQTHNTVTGTVTDATTSQPIEGALVQVAGSEQPISTTTGASGEYLLEGVPVGEQSITVSATGYVGETVDAVDAETAGAIVDFSLQPVAPETEPNSVTGTVTDATTGEPIEDASVRVDGSEQPMSADTGESGAYTLEGVPTGENSFIASADGYDSETVGAEVSGTEGISVNFTLQPSVKAEAESTELEGDDDGGKVAGRRKGYVGIFTIVTGGATGSGAHANDFTSSATGSGIAGSFVVTTKKGDIEVQIPEEGLESVTKRPGQSPGIPEDGDRVAVLVEFVDHDVDGLVQVARQVIVKPAPKLPVVGVVTKITTAENGVRTLTFMRPNGATKVVRLGSKGKPPEVGDLVTAFQGPGDDDDDDGPPTIRGFVRAQDVRQRLEGFLEDLSNRADKAIDKVEERLADRLAKLADKLESHAAKHAKIIERISQNDKLPPQAMAGILNGLDRARRGHDAAKVKATEARSKSGPSRGPGLQVDRGNSGRGNQGGPDNSGSSSQGGRDNSGFSSQGDRDNGNSGGRGNSGNGGSGGGDLDSSSDSGGDDGNSGSSN